MNIKNEIISFDPITGSIVVKYFCDEVPDGLSFNIDVPIENGQLADITTINNLIEIFKPIGQLERIAQLKAITVPEFLAEKIPTPIVVNTAQPTIMGVDKLPI